VVSGNPPKEQSAICCRSTSAEEFSPCLRTSKQQTTGLRISEIKKSIPLFGTALIEDMAGRRESIRETRGVRHLLGGLQLPAYLGLPFSDFFQLFPLTGQR